MCLLGMVLGKSQVLNNSSGDLNKKNTGPHSRRRLQSYLAYSQNPMYAQPTAGMVYNPEMGVDQRQLVLTNAVQQPLVQQQPMQYSQQAQMIPANQAMNLGQTVGNEGFMRSLTTTINGLNSAIENYNRELSSPVVQNGYQAQQSAFQPAPINLQMPQQQSIVYPRQMVAQQPQFSQPQTVAQQPQYAQQPQFSQPQTVAQQPQYAQQPQFSQPQMAGQQPQFIDPSQIAPQQPQFSQPQMAGQQPQFMDANQIALQQQMSQVQQQMPQVQSQVQTLPVQPVQPAAQPKPQVVAPAPRQAAVARGPITLLKVGGRIFPQVNGRSMSLISEPEPVKAIGNQIQF
jgi:hypothetical protein